MREGRRYKICKGEPWRRGSLYNFTFLLSDAKRFITQSKWDD